MTGESGFFGLLQATTHPSLGHAVIAGLGGPDSGTTALQGTTLGSIGPDAAWHHAGQSSVACHGEIYNMHDLCKQLDMPADTSRPHILLAGWRRWSTGLLPRLNGVFALVLRDGDELLLYRDPSALKNLYVYTGCSGQIAFATNLDALLRLPGTVRRLARRSLHEYLRFLDIAAPNTLFEDVTSMEAGQAVRWSARGTETLPLPWPGADEPSPTTFAEAVAMLDVHLHRSVQTRLAGSTRPAAFLSGGVDSSLICAIAARHRADLTALTVGFDTAVHDEAPIAQRVAAHLGIAHQVLRFTRGQYLSAFETLSQHMEQPMADPATPATVLAYGHCRSHFDVVLDGMGADESVGAMPPRHVRLAVGYASMLPLGVRRMLAALLQATPGLAGYAPVLDFEHPADTMIRWRGFTRPEIEALCGEPVSFAHTQFYRTFAGFPRRAHYERYSALLNALPCDRLNQAMLISAAPVRYPFWDSDIDRFIRQLRTDFRHLPAEPKRILRAVLARYVPRKLWDLPKHGFNFPLWEFLSAEDFRLVRRYLDPGRWRRTALISVDHLQRYAQQFVAGDQRLAFRVWALVVLGAWLEKHDELD